MTGNDFEFTNVDSWARGVRHAFVISVSHGKGGNGDVPPTTRSAPPAIRDPLSRIGKETQNPGEDRFMNGDISPIVIYSRPSCNRGVLMSDSDLQTFSIFDDRPAPNFIDGWRQYIIDTGAPEKYSGVSTSKPDRSANVVLLSDEIRVPTAMRPGGDKVPCPICSPNAGKFGKGRMAYFPDDSAVRFIGHDCAKKHLGSNYTEAERLFRIEAQCASIITLWPKLQALLPQLSPVVDGLYVVGKRLGEMRFYIEVQASGFANAFYRDLVSIGSRVVTSQDAAAKSHAVRGLGFLAEEFSPDKDAQKLIDICRDIRSPLPGWQVGEGDSAASKEITKRGRSAIRRLREMAALRDQIEEASQFFDPLNLRLLEQWRASGNSPFTVIRFERDGDRVGGVIESYAGRYEWSVAFPSDLMGKLPKKEEITALKLMEVLG
jgi:hypothetical protein